LSNFSEANMKKFTNPLDGVKIAGPCSADWNEMRGDERQRYCAMCRLNVYNLSAMTRGEAESFLINTEGRVCVKFYRRSDGTVLTKDCPVGWARVKRKVSRFATALFSLIAGFFTGNLIFNQLSFDDSDLMKEVQVVPEVLPKPKSVVTRGQVSNLDEIKSQINKAKSKKNRKMVVGQIEKIRQLKDEPVVLWID
jgi:hypothetical protein